MMYFNIAIFLIVVAIVINFIVPRSKIQVWLYSLLIPSFFCAIYCILLASLYDSTFPYSYRLGSAFAVCFVPLIISVITLFFFLKKKLAEEKQYRYPKGIFIAIALFSIIGCIFLFIHNYNKKTSQEIIDNLYIVNPNNKTKQKQEIELDPNNEAIYQEIVAENFHKEMLDAAQSYNALLPEFLGDGLTMISCSLEDHSLVYTIECKYLSSSDITNEFKSTTKKDLVDGLKEEKESETFVAHIKDMIEFGYDYKYRFVNNKEEELCTITIPPSEI